MRRIFSALGAFLLLGNLVACSPSVPNRADSHSRIFVDSCGREISLPEEIDHIAVSGSMAQIVIFALASDLLVGISSAWDEAAEPYIPEEYKSLPVLGQLYGGKGGFNLETLLNSGAQVVIDIGESKDSTADDLNKLQQQTGIPFVHIDASLSTLDETYYKLGELLGRGQEASALSSYCRDTYDRAKALADRVSRSKCLYLLGENGLHVVGQNTYHSGVIDLMADNPAVLEHPSSKGTGNEVDMEQLLLWDPEFIIFAPDSIGNSVANDSLWQNLRAIREGNYAVVPVGPYNWLSMPPSAQQLLGLIWMGALLYPEECGYDLYEEVSKYFDLFYHVELTRTQFERLINSSGGN